MYPSLLDLVAVEIVTTFVLPWKILYQTCWTKLAHKLADFLLAVAHLMFNLIQEPTSLRHPICSASMLHKHSTLRKFFNKFQPRKDQ